MVRSLESMLEDLGLDPDEATVYKLLVSVGSGTVGKLSAMTRYSRTKVYAIMGKLTSKGWIKSISDKPKTYVPVDPEKVVQRKKESMNASSEGVLDKLSPLYENSMMHLSEIVTYRGDKVIKKVMEMIEGARKEINIVTAFLPPDAFKQIAPKFKKLKNQGVKINIIASNRFREQKLLTTLQNEATVGFASIPDAGLLIVDGEEILLGSIEGKNEEYASNLLGIWTRSKEMVAFLDIILGRMYNPQEVG